MIDFGKLTNSFFFTAVMFGLSKGGAQLAKAEHYRLQQTQPATFEYVIPGSTPQEQTRWVEAQLVLRRYAYGDDAVESTKQRCGIQANEGTTSQIYCVLNALPLRETNSTPQTQPNSIRRY